MNTLRSRCRNWRLARSGTLLCTATVAAVESYCRQPVVVIQNELFGRIGRLIWIVGSFEIREGNMKALRKTAFFRFENLSGGPDLTVGQMKKRIVRRSIRGNSGESTIGLAVKKGTEFLFDCEMDSSSILRLFCFVSERVRVRVVADIGVPALMKLEGSDHFFHAAFP